MKTNNDAITGCIGAIFGIGLLLVINTLVDGYTLTVLWGWFMVTTFGFRVINIPEAIGLGMIATFLTAHAAKSDLKDYDSFGEWLVTNIVTVFVKSALYLIMGSIVFSFMNSGR